MPPRMLTAGRDVNRTRLSAAVDHWPHDDTSGVELSAADLTPTHAGTASARRADMQYQREPTTLCCAIPRPLPWCRREESEPELTGGTAQLSADAHQLARLFRAA